MEYLATFPNQLEASCGTAVHFTSGQSPATLRNLAPVKALYRVENGSYLPIG